MANAIPVRVPGTGGSTLEYVLPANMMQFVQSVNAVINNTGGADTKPTLTVLDSTNEVIADVPQGRSIPAGDTGRSTWALRLADESGGAVGKKLAWCVAEVANNALAPGVSSSQYGALLTNDPAAFTIDGIGRITFHKEGTFQIFSGFFVTTTLLGGAVANPWTTFVQAGSSGGIGVHFRGFSGATVSGVMLSVAIQQFDATWLATVVIDAAHVGNTLNWVWQNGTAVNLDARGVTSILELTP